MRALATKVPNADEVLAMSAEELAYELLALVKSDAQRAIYGSEMFHPGNLVDDLSRPEINGATAYPHRQLSDVVLAVKEAWAWAEREGLVLPADGINGRNGFKVLSRRAREIDLNRPLPRSDLSQLLPKSVLRPEIRDRAWLPFIRGEFDTAILQAMKQVEISLRAVAGPEHANASAVQIARLVFDATKGPLTDTSTEKGEREAVAHLYAGALGVLKNPHSHRNVDVDDAGDAAAIILFANFLLRDIDGRLASFTLT